MKKCNLCGKEYPNEYCECPFCKSQKVNKKNNKAYIIPIGIMAYLLVVIIVVTSIFNPSGLKTILVKDPLKGNDENIVEIKDDAILIENENLEKSLNSIIYSKETNEYTIKYRTLPAEFSQLEMDDLFVVASNSDAKNPGFQVGFSGIVKEITDNSISFVIPTFAQVINYISIQNDSLNATNVSFVPEQGVELSSFNSASVGFNNASTNTLSLGDYTGEVTYKKTDKESQLEGYDLVAKRMQLKINKKGKTVDQNDIEVSGKITLDYPAIKFNMTYDSQDEYLENYDVGFISEESVSIKVKGSANVGVESMLFDVDNYGIIDIMDTDDIEEGKIVLGSFFVGYQVPLAYNIKNKTPYIGIGLVFQLCLTANGKIEIELESKQSAYIQAETNSNKETKFEIKNKNYPNPVLGEVGFEDENYDEFDINVSVKGTLDVEISLGIDIGFSILGTIPIKIANDILCFELVASFDENKNSKHDIMNNFDIPSKDAISFYQFKSQSKLKINIGAKVRVGPAKYKIGEFGYQEDIWKKVWIQYPKTVAFSKDECDFGGIKLGQTYTEDSMNDIFYKKLKQNKKNLLTEKVKDKFLQSTVDEIVNKMNFGSDEISDFLPFLDDYDVVCFSEGALYFMEGNRVKAELITSKNVYNSSGISCASDDNFVRKIYSEPDKSQSVKIEIGEVLAFALNKIGVGEINQYDGTDLKLYKYTDDDTNMDIILNGSGNIIFIVVYEE